MPNTFPKAVPIKMGRLVEKHFVTATEQVLSFHFTCFIHVYVRKSEQPCFKEAPVPLPLVIHKKVFETPA